LFIIIRDLTNEALTRYYINLRENPNTTLYGVGNILIKNVKKR